MLLKPNKIIIHHSATLDGQTFSWSAIRDYHVKERKWLDIGYHAGIEEVNGRFICVFGRPDVVPGAHTVGENGRSLGFCFVGNFDADEPSHARLRVAARNVLAPWLLRHGLGVGALRPHAEFAAKTCPGKKFNMDLLRQICEDECRGLLLRTYSNAS